MTGVNSKVAAVLGGTGFVGKSIVQALQQQGWEIRIVHAPRIDFSGAIPDTGLPSDAYVSETLRLSEQVKGVEVVVNAAGDPNASSLDLDSMMGPNAVLPLIVKRAAEIVVVKRFIHISSSVVQGDREVLDSSQNLRPFSPYSKAKAYGEKWLLSEPTGETEVVIYRPPSVHAHGRGVTEKIRSLASSPLASVAGAGNNQTPQALLENVADAVAFLVTSSKKPPAVVHHPWEGLTSADLLRNLGGREPRHLPQRLAKSFIKTLRNIERHVDSIAPNRRRLELLWFGQKVAPSWFDDSDWMPVLGKEKWADLSRKHG